MANQKEIEAIYNWVDYFHILRLGEYADITCALFDGDFNKTLEQAQRDKHESILKGIGFKPGQRILDIGCGWGPILNAIRERGGQAVGLTLSSAQNTYNLNKGLKSRLQDYKTINPKELGKFDGVVSVGSLEHFCSEEEFKEGKQNEVYGQFFKFCHDVLPKGGKLYLQTMTWGKKIPNPSENTLKSPENSDELILARLRKFYPGSWLPSSRDHLIACAAPYFRFLSSNNGRLDYIETQDRWNQSTKNLYTLQKIFPALWGAARLIPRYFTDPDFRVQISSMDHRDQKECFVREIMSHERMFFERK
ncbi:MAG: class I SAM-dependent methyltransferase [Nanoarchaeota archaeon]|nr:class I SAM-dependent methyltransferase [Nanoarchaeota archaeon]